MALAACVLLRWGDYFPPGDVRRERTCRSERNQVSLISSEPSPGVTAKAGLQAHWLQKPLRASLLPEEGLPRVSRCASVGLVGAGGALGHRRAHVCWSSCSPAPTHRPCLPNYITALLDPTTTSHATPSGVQAVKAPPKEQEESGMSRAPTVVVAVLSPDAPVLGSNPWHLLCTHTSRTAPPAT